jgi:hypothetical protein
VKTLKIFGLAGETASDVVFDIVGGGHAELCEGLHKLLQMSVLYITTAYGTIPSMPTFGNKHVSALTPQNTVTIDSEDRLSNSFGLLRGDLLAYLRQQTRGLPLSEQPGSLSIDYSQVGDRLTVLVNLSSAAGIEAVYNLSLFSKGL